MQRKKFIFLSANQLNDLINEKAKADISVKR